MYPEHHLVRNGPITACQVCNSKKLHMVLDLGHQPPCDSLLTKEMLNEPETAYPLRMVWCQDCSLVQLDYCIDGSVVYYPDYPYRPGVTKEIADYMAELSKSLVAKYQLDKKDLVIDIGSNDGLLLQSFLQHKINVLGVDPTNAAKIAIENGVPTVQAFFDTKVAGAITQKYGQASLVTATNMFAHMAAIGEVVSGVQMLLKDDGVFMVENHYLLDVVKDCQFDTIYHEHLRTYSLQSLIKLFSYYDMTIIDAELGSRYGGNIRIFAKKGKDHQVSESVDKLLNLEEEAGLYELETYQEFAQRAKKAKEEFIRFLVKARQEDKYVVANSCPARSSTLLNYYGADADLIPYIAEQPTSPKLHKYLPGKHIPIVNNEILLQQQPDYIILLAWHYAEPIMQQLRARGVKSDFIMPLPDFKIIKNGQES